MVCAGWFYKIMSVELQQMQRISTHAESDLLCAWGRFILLESHE